MLAASSSKLSHVVHKVALHTQQHIIMSIEGKRIESSLHPPFAAAWLLMSVMMV
jgi:hypothetical protein